MAEDSKQQSYDDCSGFIAGYINDNESVWHFHPEYEMVLNLKSNGIRIVGDSVEQFDKYDMVLIAGNIPHAWNYYVSEKGLPGNHAIIVHFRHTALGEAFLARHEMEAVRKLLKTAARGIVFSAEDARKAEKYFISMTDSSGIDKMIDFFNILRILCNSRNKTLLCSEDYLHTSDDRGNKRMAEVYAYLRENYFMPLTLKKVSVIARMNPFAFSRLFKKHCGSGFVEYLNRIRTSKACYLLRETSHQVHDIASECGFSSISNFNKQFRKTEGISPRDYRAQFR